MNLSQLALFIIAGLAALATLIGIFLLFRANRRKGFTLARIGLVIFFLCFPPLGRYGLDFLVGYEFVPNGYMLGGDVLFILIAPVLVGIAIGVLVPAQRLSQKYFIALGSIFLSGILAFFVPPPGAIAYNQGFAYRIQREAAFGELQHWSLETLQRFEAGSFSPSLAPTYWDPGDIGIPTKQLPAFLKSGLFQAGENENYGPEVSLGKIGGKLNPNHTCLIIAWYDHGLILGPPDLALNWKPWYSKKLSPEFMSIISANNSSARIASLRFTVYGSKNQMLNRPWRLPPSEANQCPAVATVNRKLQTVNLPSRSLNSLAGTPALV